MEKEVEMRRLICVEIGKKNLEQAKVEGARKQHRGVEKYQAGPQINGSQWVMTNGWSTSGKEEAGKLVSSSSWLLSSC